MKLYLVSFAAISAMVLSACSSRTLDITTDSITASTTVNSQIRVRKGELIYSENKQELLKGAELLSDFRAQTLVTHHKAPAGEQLIYRTSEGQEFYCTLRKTHIDPITGPFNYSCFRDIDKNDDFDEVYILSNNLTYKKEIPPAPYKKTMIENAYPYSIQLYFLGLENGKIVIEQRLSNMTTDESSVMAKYCFSDIALKSPIYIPVFPIRGYMEKMVGSGSSMSMEVISATEETISARIVKGFPAWDMSGNWQALKSPMHSKGC